MGCSKRRLTVVWSTPRQTSLQHEEGVLIRHLKCSHCERATGHPWNQSFSPAAVYAMQQVGNALHCGRGKSRGRFHRWHGVGGRAALRDTCGTKLYIVSSPSALYIGLLRSMMNVVCDFMLVVVNSAFKLQRNQ